MVRAASGLSEIAFLAMRIVFGLLFAEHGAQKLLGAFGGVGGHTVPLLSLFGLAGIIELACGLLIAIGLFSRWAAFLASGEMAAAYFMQHAPHSVWPIVNRGELAVLYCFAFLYIAARGGGRWAVTHE